MRDISSHPSVRHREVLLYLICGAQFLEAMNLSIVNVALPAIRSSFGFTDTTLQWVVSVYALMFAGFLLLGGRAADLLGRRRVLVSGVVLFALASLICGIAPSALVLIIGRALQGIGAAITIPAAMSTISTTFTEEVARSRALALFGGMGAVGFTAGLIAGGLLTDILGWRSVFLVNVPVAGGIALGLLLLAGASRIATQERSIDLPGALTVTAGLLLLVYAITQAEAVGWRSPVSFGMLALAVAFLLTFLAIEARTQNPLMPLRLFTSRSFVGANIVGVFLYATFVGSVFFATLYLQLILGYSPTRTGLAFVPLSVSSLVAAQAAPALMQRIGIKTTLVGGMASVAVGMILFSRMTVSSAYLTFVLPIFILIGFGISVGYTAAVVAAVADIDAQEHGLAGGIVNTFFQVGAGVGLAILTTVATAREQVVGVTGSAAMLMGFQAALIVGAILAAIGAIIAAVSIRTPLAQGLHQVPEVTLEN